MIFQYNIFDSFNQKSVSETILNVNNSLILRGGLPIYWEWESFTNPAMRFLNISHYKFHTEKEYSSKGANNMLNLTKKN